MLSLCLLNLHAEYIIRNVEMDEALAGIKIARRNINNLRYADDTPRKWNIFLNKSNKIYAGRNWGQEEKGTTEDEMVGWHHQLTQWTWVWVDSGSW